MPGTPRTSPLTIITTDEYAHCSASWSIQAVLYTPPPPRTPLRSQIKLIALKQIFHQFDKYITHWLVQTVCQVTICPSRFLYK